MKTLPVITISRQYGSQGREAGRILAQQLGIPCYDYEVILRAAKESGLEAELFEREERSAAEMLKRLQEGQSASISPVSMELFQAQAKVIEAMADAGPCIIVGRCADTVLRERENVLHIYVYASVERRIQNTIKKRSVNRRIAKLMVQRIDEGRAAYHSLFSHHVWGDTSAYDLCVCTDKLTPEETAAVMKSFVELRSKE